MIGVEINGSKVSDLTPINGLKNLRFLLLVDSQASDLSPIKNLKNLEVLIVESANITKQQIEDLQKSLPNCTISHEDN